MDKELIFCPVVLSVFNLKDPLILDPEWEEYLKTNMEDYLGVPRRIKDNIDEVDNSSSS